MVMEAVFFKVQKEDEDAAKAAKRNQWKKNTTDLNQFR